MTKSIYPRRAWLRVGLPVVLAAGLAGCAATNPYIEPPHPRPGLMRHGDGTPALDAANGLQPAHVTVAVAREYARTLQDAYRAAAAGQTRARAGLDAFILGTGTAAVGVAAAGGSATLAGALGLTAGGATLLGERWLIPARRAIYFQGARALECVIDAANRHPVVNPRASQLLAAAARLEAKAADLERALFLYEEQLLREQLNARHRSMHLRVGPSRRADLAQFRLIARQALGAAEALDPLGQILLSKVEDIRLRVDAEIAKGEPDLLRYDESLRKALSAFSPQPIGSTAATGQADAADRMLPPARHEASTQTGGSAELDELSRDVNNQAVEAQAAAQKLLDLLAAAADDSPKLYPQTLFVDCALAEPVKAVPLSLDPAVLEIPRDTAFQATVAVRGGMPPYRLANIGRPNGVRVELAGAADSSHRLTVKLAASAVSSLASSPVVAIVEDAQGNARSLVLRADGASAIKSSGPSSPERRSNDQGKGRNGERSPKPNGAAASPSTLSAERVRQIQDFLKKMKVSCGDSAVSVSGLWDECTLIASRTFIAENWETAAKEISALSGLEAMQDSERQARIAKLHGAQVGEAMCLLIPCLR